VLEQAEVWYNILNNVVGEDIPVPYLATIKNQTYRLEIDEESRTISFEDTPFALDWRQLEPLAADAKGNVGVGGRYSLLIGGHSYDIFARRLAKPDEKDSQTYEILIGDQRFEVKVEDERAQLLAGLVKGGAASGGATISAPMPGLVIGVPVEVGETVAVGQTVLVLEAMKMENDLAAPIAGTVKEIRANKGQTVDQGAVLVVIEANM
jgi:biotin carboxyl carrier protein